MGDLRPGLDVAGLAGIAVAVGREVHHKLFICHIYLNGADITLFAKVHAEPFARLCTGGAPPAAAVLVDCQCRAAALGSAGSRDRLFVAQQHPFRLLAGGIEFASRDAVRIIGKVLVAVENPVLVEPGREQPHPALKVIVDGNAHGRGVPPVAIAVGNGAAVACAGDESAGLCGKRVGCLPHKGTQRRSGGVYTIGVSVVLGAGAGVLQVIEAVMLCHKGTLNVGFAHGVEHGSQAFGTQAGDVCHLRRQIQLAGFRVIELLHGLVQHAGFPVHNAVVAGAFVAQYGFIAEDQLLLFTDGGHGVRVHLHAVDGRSIGAAPVEVHPAVIIAEQIRVPESKGRRYFGKRLGQGVSGAQDGTVAPLAAGAEVQEIAHLPHIGGIIVDQQIRVCMEVPVQQVVRIPEACRHGNKEIIFALEGYQRGVCTLPETCCTGAFLHVLVTVAQIKGVTIGLFHRITPWKCPAIHGSAV